MALVLPSLYADPNVGSGDLNTATGLQGFLQGLSLGDQLGQGFLASMEKGRARKDAERELARSRAVEAAAVSAAATPESEYSQALRASLLSGSFGGAPGSSGTRSSKAGAPGRSGTRSSKAGGAAGLSIFDLPREAADVRQVAAAAQEEYDQRAAALREARALRARKSELADELMFSPEIDPDRAQEAADLDSRLASIRDYITSESLRRQIAAGEDAGDKIAMAEEREQTRFDAIAAANRALEDPEISRLFDEIMAENNIDPDVLPSLTGTAGPVGPDIRVESLLERTLAEMERDKLIEGATLARDKALADLPATGGTSLSGIAGRQQARAASVGQQAARTIPRASEATRDALALPEGLDNPALEFGLEPSQLLDPAAVQRAVMVFEATGDDVALRAIGGEIPANLTGIMGRIRDYNDTVRYRQGEALTQARQAVVSDTLAEQAFTVDELMDYARGMFPDVPTGKLEGLRSTAESHAAAGAGLDEWVSTLRIFGQQSIAGVRHGYADRLIDARNVAGMARDAARFALREGEYTFRQSNPDAFDVLSERRRMLDSRKGLLESRVFSNSPPKRADWEALGAEYEALESDVNRAAKNVTGGRTTRTTRTTRTPVVSPTPAPTPTAPVVSPTPAPAPTSVVIDGSSSWEAFDAARAGAKPGTLILAPDGNIYEKE